MSSPAPDQTATRGLYADPVAFTAALHRLVPALDRPATARGAFFVRPEHFALAEESATDNRYMATGGVDRARALREHDALVEAIDRVLPTQVFPGLPDAPDAVFPNNVFATVPGKLMIGAMRHPVRQREAVRDDIPDWFRKQHGYSVESLIAPGVVAELTGALVPDRAAGIGWFGLSERLNRAGAEAMHRAFGFRISLMFDLAPGEYHTNVVMSVLAGRALVLHAGSIADPAVVKAIAQRYAPHVIWLSDEEKANFVGNCIALAHDTVFMSTRADKALSRKNRDLLHDAGFSVRSVDLTEIEQAGGSLRCCVAEIF
ncbi:MAG TPA: arginine deiminase-related protein [Patescibacteria group bacterium]|nr:arginine deiminase-related protein [Patescibacteria group bacterium]